MKILVCISTITIIALLIVTLVGCSEQAKQVVATISRIYPEVLGRSVELNGVIMEVPTSWAIIRSPSVGNAVKVRAVAPISESGDKPWVEISTVIQNLSPGDITDSTAKSSQAENKQDIIIFRNFTSGTSDSNLIVLSVPSKNVIVTVYSSATGGWLTDQIISTVRIAN